MKSPLPLKHSRPVLLLALAACTLATGLRSAVAALTVDTLRCESIDGTMGIDAPAPRLGWLPRSTTRGESVTAYQVQVASSQANLTAGVGDLWDSGKVASNQNTQVAYAGSALASWQQVFWQVRLWNGAGAVSAWSSPATWTMGVLNASDWAAKWITPSTAATDVGSSMLRREFTVGSGLVKALVNVTGLGQYEMSLNGARVGTDVLSPGWTNYTKTVLYDTYDITSMLQIGTNAVGIMLGNGMYNVPNNSGRYTKFTGTVGPRQTIVQIRLVYANGTVQTIASDGTWKWSTGPVTFNTVFGGEDYDARLEPAGWNKAGFNDSAWSAATVGAGPGGTLRGASYAAPPLRKQTEVFQPTPAIAPTASSMVYDFGQNASNIPTLTTYGPAGASVQLWYSEVGTTGNPGSISQINSPSWATYTLKGSTASAPETFTPRFTYIGYRYLQVKIAGGATVVSLTSNPVHTSAAPTGNFTCSNSLFNNTRTIIRWAQRSNLVSVLTDCPTREKLGWQEQYHLHGPSLRYEFDLASMYRKTFSDMADSQQSNGMATSISPEFTVFGGDYRDSPEWGSALVLSPQQQYDFYEDQASIILRYNNMKRYVDYLSSRASGYIVSYGLGDWYDIGPGAPGYSQLTPAGITATAIYYADALTVSSMAQMLGNTSDASTYTTLANNIQSAFNAKFYNPATSTYGSGSQTSNAMPLAMGLVPAANKQAVLNSLVAQVRADGNLVTAGDVGHRYLLRALADGGRSDVIYDIHGKVGSRGYGYILSQGYTALTEGWDGSNSKNHFMLGHITEWFYHDLAGIQSDPAGPGFKKIIIKPALVGNLTSASATYHSIRGDIASSWTNGASGLTMNVTIPVAATATIYVPAANASVVQEGGVPASSASGVQFLRMESGAAVYAVGPGTYAFSSLAVPSAPTGVTAVAGTNGVQLAWTGPVNAATYNVWRAATSGGPYTALTQGITGTAFNDVTAQLGSTYYYVVTATNAAAESVYSNEASLALTTPAAPAGLTATAGSTVVQLTWTPIAGVSGYRIKRGTASGGPYGTTVVSSTPGNAYVDTGLTNGTTYYYTVTALIFANEGAASAPASAAPAASANPVARDTNAGGVSSSNYDSTNTNENIAKLFDGSTSTKWYQNAADSGVWIQYQFPNGLAWTVTSYALSSANDVPGRDPAAWQLQASNDGSTWTTLDTQTGQTFPSRQQTKTYNLANTNPYRFYRLFITADAVAGSGIQMSEFALSSSASDAGDKTPPVLSLPASITVPATSNNTAAVSFNATAADAVGGAVVVSSAPPSGTRFPVGTTTVQCSAADAAGNTATGSFTVTVTPPFAAPSGLSATPLSSSQIRLNWTDNATGESNYRVESSPAGAGIWTIQTSTLPAGANTSLVNGLSASTSYDFRVEATGPAGSSLSATLTAATPAAPITAQEQAPPVFALSPGANGSASCTVPLSVVGHTYQLQSVDDLAAGSWLPVPGVAAQAGNGANLQFTTPVDTSVKHRFYRIAISLQ